MPEEQQSFFEETQELAEEYVKNRWQLFKLQTAEKSARLLTLAFAGLVIGLLSFFILLFVSIMAGYYFSEILHSQFYGFGIVAGFYVLLLIVVLLLRKKFLDNYVSGIVLKIFFDSNEENEDDETKK
jgi:uncharacterized ion transporter superfamily protein YfcC